MGDAANWVGRGLADTATFGQYEVGKYAYDKLTAPPPTVNAAGSILTDADQNALNAVTDPTKKSQMFQNWLTAGGPPKPIDPGQIFAEEGTVAADKERAGAGAGFAGLFGFGNMIGSIAPLNTSPMQPGVPYAAPPVPTNGPSGGGNPFMPVRAP